MGIRVAGRRGRKLGPVRALGRAAFCVFFPIGFFWCVISPRRHSIQDIAVYSAVVYDWMPHGPPSWCPSPTPLPACHPSPGSTRGRRPSRRPRPSRWPPVDAEPAAPVASRRYRWARAIDPYDD